MPIMPGHTLASVFIIVQSCIQVQLCNVCFILCAAYRHKTSYKGNGVMGYWTCWYEHLREIAPKVNHAVHYHVGHSTHRFGKHLFGKKVPIGAHKATLVQVCKFTGTFGLLGLGSVPVVSNHSTPTHVPAPVVAQVQPSGLPSDFFDLLPFQNPGYAPISNNGPNSIVGGNSPNSPFLTPPFNTSNTQPPVVDKPTENELFVPEQVETNTPVPEPSTIALMFVGIVVLVVAANASKFK